MLITSSMGTTTKIIQQTSVHLALFWWRSCRWNVFITLYFKGNSRSGLYRKVKFVSRNAVLGSWHIKFFSCKISSRCRMWEKCCPGNSQRMQTGGLHSL